MYALQINKSNTTCSRSWPFSTCRDKRTKNANTLCKRVLCTCIRYNFVL